MSWTNRHKLKTENGLAVFTSGNGPALILLHGVGLRSEAWRDIFDFLCPFFTVHAIDLPGHGESEGFELSNPKLANYSDLIGQYLKSIEQPVCLAGHSMGAMIALDLAARMPVQITKVAALNAVYQRSPKARIAVQTRANSLKDTKQTDLNTDVTIRRWFGKAPERDNLRAAELCRQWLHETPIQQYYQAYHVFAYHEGPSAGELESLQARALFITGSEEPNSTPDMSREMARLAPNGTARIISGAAHMMPMTHAVEVASALKDCFGGP